MKQPVPKQPQTPTDGRGSLTVYDGTAPAGGQPQTARRAKSVEAGVTVFRHGRAS